MTSRARAVVTLNAAARQRYELAFDAAHTGQHYHRIRPGYQSEILDFLTDQQPGLAIDLGAGTGLFTDQLVTGGWDTVAVDPAANMLDVLAARHPDVTRVVSPVETLDITAWKNAANLVVSAQAWHWIDTVQGSQKVSQLLADDGVFGIIHHQLDTALDWVLRLARITHSGDVHNIDVPPVTSDQFTKPQGAWWRWTQQLDIDQVHHLMMSRAYYLRTHEKQRRRMHDNLQWYLTEHLGYAPNGTVELPYVTAAWRMYKR